MLLELWDFWTSESTTWARREGYLYSGIALAHRARRCQKYWGPHIQNCHAVVQSFLSKYPDARSIGILGSGLLLETPLHLLASQFQKIVLIDAVHTKDVRRQVQVQYSDRKGDLIWEERDLNKTQELNNLDLLISANLLSQLPNVPMQNLAKEDRTDLQLRTLQLEYQNHHLSLLKKSKCPALLFSDSSLITRSIQGQDSEAVSTVAVDLPWETRWEWNLAPAPEVFRNDSVVLKMGSLEIESL